MTLTSVRLWHLSSHHKMLSKLDQCQSMLSLATTATLCLTLLTLRDQILKVFSVLSPLLMRLGLCNEEVKTPATLV